MTETLRPDLCVLGAGAAGLSVAAGAAQLGADVVLFEPGRMGGECLNTGCVPSKALLAAAQAAQGVRLAPAFGVAAAAPEIDWSSVRRHLDGAIAAIAPNDSEERMTALGVRVVRAPARFLGRREVAGGGLRLRPRFTVIATGSRPAVPAIPGLDAVPHLTNETIFALPERPRHLLVLGGGPIGCEMAQAFRRLGSRVTLLSDSPLLPRDDPEAAAVVAGRLRDEGVDVREGIEIAAFAAAGNGLEARLADGERVAGSHLLVAAGRRVAAEGLRLEAAGIDVGPQGIPVDRRLRTANRRVFAIGDVATVAGQGAMRFTHMAAHHAGVVVRQALFRLPGRVETRAVPWVTYTDPELAHVGLSETDALAAGRPFRLWRAPVSETDRARTDAVPEGFAKIVTTPGGRVLGATIVARHAGELLLPWVLAVKRGMRVGEIAGAIVPYPTLSEVGKAAATQYFMPKLTAPWAQGLVRLLARLG